MPITTNQFQKVTFNFSDSNLVRNEMLEGRNHIVAPMTMLTEGVHAGSNGPLFYPGDEVQKNTCIWNQKPIVVYHPTINGQGVSACSPEIINTRKIGVIMNSVPGTTKIKINNKDVEVPALKAEAWIDPERAKIVDNRILTAIEKKTVMELSTGVFTDNEENAGEWNGEKYNFIARNYKPDHLALLPDQKGACSVADGAGFLKLNSEQIENRIPSLFAKDFFSFLKAAGIDTDKLIYNEIGMNDKRNQLNNALRAKFKMAWIEEVYDSYLIYENEGKLWKLDYSIDDKNVVKISGMPEQVIRTVNYKTAKGVLLNSNEINPGWVLKDGKFVMVRNKNDDEDGNWITIGGRHIFIKGDGAGPNTVGMRE